MLANSENAAVQPGHARAEAAPAPARGRRWLVPAILLVSLLPRLPNLGAPPLERHGFRQTQTAITVQAFLDGGLDLFGYEMPVFGPPWKVPFEFPTFQATAYALARTGVPLDLACRVTALVWFYLSAILLLALARRFAGETTAITTLVFYVFSPFGILWSRACLIDFASVVFALGYVLAVASWAARPRLAALAAAVAAGALASLTKITTVAAVVPALALVAFAALRRAWPGGAAARRSALASLAAMAAVPLAVGVAWVRWTDVLKEASPATQWLTSARQTRWTLGTLAQRLTFDDWAEIFVRMNWIIPGLFWIAVAFGIVALWRTKGHARLALVAAFGGVFLPILVFFNLYAVHDYYLIAVMPGLALAAGAGMAEILTLRIPRRGWVFGVVFVVALATAEKPFIKYAGLSYEDTRRQPVVGLARLVEDVTPREGWVVVQGDDWSPRIPYLAHRRAFMVRPPEVEARLIAGRPEVATLVCFTCPSDFLALWPRRKWIAREGGADVYRALEGPEAARAPAR